jgi:hypothetical protein
MNDNKVKHLEMIEVVIDRMGHNSFQLKGWAVALMSIVGALAAKGSDKSFMLLGLIPLIAFWFLDSYYLQLERKYRVLYERIRNKGENDIDFDMSLKHLSYENDAEAKKCCICSSLFSFTEVAFYIVIAVAFVTVMMVSNWL